VVRAGDVGLEQAVLDVAMAWTALGNWREGRDVLDASASYGLVVVLVASLVLGGAALARGLELLRAPARIMKRRAVATRGRGPGTATQTRSGRRQSTSR
jgi:hypothetical protein